MSSYRPLILSPRLWIPLIALCCVIAVDALPRSRHTVIVVNSTSRQCYNAQNQLISCPASKTGIIVGAVIGGIACFIGLVYFCAICPACSIFSCGLFTCALCSLCKRRKKTKVSDGETYQQLSEPFTAPMLPTNTSYSATPAPTFPPKTGEGEKPYDTHNESVSDLGHQPYDEYYVAPQLGYGYKSSDTLNASKSSFPEPTPSYQPPSYPPPPV